MNKDSEDRLQQRFAELPEIPFPEALHDQILEEVFRQQSSVAASRNRQKWKPWLAAVSGVVATAVVLTAVMTQPVQQHFNAASNPLTAYGLQLSPLKVISTRIGDIPGEPNNSSVVARIENTGSVPIGKTDVIGVLAFPANTAATHLFQSDSLTFVNGPSQPIAPGQTAKWTFHPIGAPSDPSTKGLTEQPYLVFYKTALKKNPSAEQSVQSHSQASEAIWKRSSLRVTDIRVVRSGEGKTWQSARVEFTLQNPGKTSIDLRQLWSITWYSAQGGGGTKAWDWAYPGTTRFFNRLESNAGTRIAPGQELEVYFNIVGSSSSDFLTRTPHVTIIQR